MNITTMIDQGYRPETIGVREFPPFIRLTLKGSVRKELFSRAARKIGTIKREYTITEEVLDALYGPRKSKIIQMLKDRPHSIKALKSGSQSSTSAVYHFLKDLKKRRIITKEGSTYYLEDDLNSLFLDEIVKIEEDAVTRRKYGISTKEVELAFFLWDAFQELDTQDKCYACAYHSKYTLADAVHRWKVGRTDIPVWAVNKLADLSQTDVCRIQGITQYHLPPGIPVNPLFHEEYKLPIQVDCNLDKIVIQLRHKMSKNNLYTFPKSKRWLFDNLHSKFGDFDDSNYRIPPVILEILKVYYGIETFKRSSARIPPRMKARWSELNPLIRIAEESSLVLHVISLSSRSNGGFEITSRSTSFLQDISAFTSGTSLGNLTVGKKDRRPHFRVYLSGSKVDILRRYARLFQDHPDLEIWLRIPLNQIPEKVVEVHADFESVEQVCRAELGQFVESILKSLERKKSGYGRVNYLVYKDEITDYFWEQKLIPSPRRIRELVEMRTAEEYLYA